MKHFLAAAALAGGLGATLLPAQAAKLQVVTATASARPASLARGSRGVLTVSFSVMPQFHINANKVNDPSLIATEWKFSPTPGIIYGRPHFPAAQSIRTPYEKKPMLVYTGKGTITIPFVIAPTAQPGRVTLNGSLGFQGCNATSCYPPGTLPIRASVTVK